MYRFGAAGAIHPSTGTASLCVRVVEDVHCVLGYSNSQGSLHASPDCANFSLLSDYIRAARLLWERREGWLTGSSLN